LHWIDRTVEAGIVADGDVVVHGPDWPRSRIPRGAPVLLQRNIGRFTRGGRERRMMQRAGLAVYDLDDGLPWDSGDLPGLGRWWKRPFPRSRVADQAVRSADRVIVGNEVLADWASSRCRDVRIVPTCIEPNDYSRRSAWAVGEQPVIGWIGSPATELYLADIAPALGEVHGRTGARVEMISGPGAINPLLAAFTTKLVWTPSAVSRIAAWDVGIMPLRNGVYERAKCGYKLLQYAASGVPAVASPVGVNAALLAATGGLAATTEEEWVDAMCQLISETPAQRASRAASGYALADAYSYASWQPRWVDAVGW
jgi:glycosyltransferase involved in cell wall biosynthesis